MPIRFVCLANSFKLGGRCLAGIVLNGKDKPVLGRDNSPKWIRPVSSVTEHGELPENQVSDIELLNIVEIDDVELAGHGHQSENVRFDILSLKVIGHYPAANLHELCEDERPEIFRNEWSYVSSSKIAHLHHSLVLIKTKKFEVTEPVSESTGRKQTRLTFTYKKTKYDLPITDPAFLNNLKKNPDHIHGVGELFLTLSLGLALDDKYYKLIAGIMY